MVLAARSMSESSRIWGSSAVIAATVGSMALTSRSFLVPKTLGRKVSIKDIKGSRYGRNPQVPFYSVKRDARWGGGISTGQTVGRTPWSARDALVPLPGQRYQHN